MADVRCLLDLISYGEASSGELMYIAAKHPGVQDMIHNTLHTSLHILIH